jgi:hypothetical protein
MIPSYALATLESLPRCGPCAYCWETPEQPCYCRMLFNTATCPGPSVQTADPTSATSGVTILRGSW